MSLPGISTHSLNCVVFDPQSRWLIAGGGGMTRRDGRSVTLHELIAWDIPAGQVGWQIEEEAKDGIADLAIRPGGAELATKCSGDITIWSADGKPLRKYESEFLGGPIVYSPDGKWFVAPKGNVLKIRDSDNGRTVSSVAIAKSQYTSAEAAAFVPGTELLVAAASVINSKGQISGKILLLDFKQEKVLKDTNIDVDPDLIAIDPQRRWLCVGGEYRSRGFILFWSIDRWCQVASQGAHGAGIDGLAVSPTGEQLASTGDDHVIRIWDTLSCKTIAKLEQHSAEGSAMAGVAWSPDGRYIAFATGGMPPEGGVFLYEHSMGQWKLIGPSAAHDASNESQLDSIGLRHRQIFGGDVTMDTVGNVGLAANQWPIMCPQCTFPDINAVPEPYLLSRGFVAPGDFSTAELGNFFVKDRARQILEIATPGSCHYYPTYEAKSRKPTDWFLAVPQTTVQTAELPEKYAKCDQCGEPKAVSHLDPLPFTSPSADIFKSQQWTCSFIGEENAWYLKTFLKVPREKVPKQQWTRLRLDRELWMSSRLLQLLKQLQIKGLNYRSALENLKPTAIETAWIAEQIERIGKQKPDTPAGESRSSDSSKWLRDYLKQHASKKPLATKQAVREWERKQKIKLPAAYTEFVTTVGRHSFADMFGEEGFSVRIVGPKDLDAQEYRRDPPENATDDSEPDSLLFAIAINGDALCFDLRGSATDYPVFYFNHETTIFEPFAKTFDGAIQRLVKRQ